MSKLSERLDVPLYPSLYYEWLNSPERFRMYYDQWLELQVTKLRSALAKQGEPSFDERAKYE